MSEHGFDPSKYLTKLGPADYLEVRWRLVWFRDACPDGVISTELVEHRFGEYAVVKASISAGAAHAEGYGSETVKDFRDYLEKAETKAIGRALSALGYGTQFSAYEFGGEAGANRPVDAPVAAGNATPQARSGVPATEKQLKMVGAVSRQLGMSDAELHQFAGVPSLADLDRAGISGLIERLKALEAESADARESGVPAPGDAGIVDWTSFWSAARSVGLPNKADAEKQIGILGPNPNDALLRLQAWAKDNARQAVLA